MNCPRCNELLHKKDIKDISIDYCKNCNGMWLWKNQLNRILTHGDFDIEENSIDEKPHSDKYPAVTCRKCSNLKMKKINFLEYSDIIFDYCPECGSFWIDKGELDNMQKYIDMVEEGSHTVKDHSAYHFLSMLSQIAYNIYH